MADDIEEEKRLAEEAAAAEAEAKAKAEEEARAAEEALLQEKPDYETLLTLVEAEKERADAAEALIVKNKNIAKRHKGEEGEPPALTEERVLEIIKKAKSEEDDSEEAKRLVEAQAKVKALEAKKAEIARALKNRDGAYSNPSGTQRDPEKQDDPKLPEGSPLKSYKHVGNGVYSKKLANGKTMFVNTRAMANEKKKWVE